MAKFTQTEVDNIVDGRMNSFRQGVGDSTYTVGSPLALVAGVEVLLTNDALAVNDVTSPDYIASRWDELTSKLAMPDEYDAPTYVNDLQFTYDPSVAAAGKILIRVYIDESGTRDFSTDPLIRTYTADYKAAAEQVGAVTTWYFGDTTGFDAKNNGVYFTVEAEANGSLYGAFFSLYRT